MTFPLARRIRFAAAFAASFLLAVAGFAADASATAAPDGPAAHPDPWQPLRRLLGTWEGEVNGEPGAGRARRDYRFILGERFIEASNVSDYPPQEKNPKGEHHEDRGIFSYDRTQKKILLRQFHLEGFVNEYVLESASADGRVLVFVTTAIENIPAGWRARETYTFRSDDEFIEKFELAEPGKDFAPYSETRFQRARRE